MEQDEFLDKRSALSKILTFSYDYDIEFAQCYATLLKQQCALGGQHSKHQQFEKQTRLEACIES